MMTATKMTLMQTNHHAGVINPGNPPSRGALGKVFAAMDEGAVRQNNGPRPSGGLGIIYIYICTHIVLASIFPEIGINPKFARSSFSGVAASDMTSWGPARSAHEIR